MSVLARSGGLFQEIANRQPGLSARWMKVHGVMERMGYKAFPQHIADHYIDALLRAMEDELAGGQLQCSEMAMVGSTVQTALSRQWLLSAYEILRTVKATPEGQKHSDLLSLYADVRLVRVPMTKQEIAEDHRLKDVDLELVKFGDDSDVIVYSRTNKVPYTPVMIMSQESGSMGWQAIDLRSGISERQIFRRDISDRMLAAFEAIAETL